MSRQTKKKPVDAALQAVQDVLQGYQDKHPKAKIDLIRTRNVSIRIRVIDPDFARKDRVDRDSAVWEFLDNLPDDVLAQVTILTLLAPAETKGWVNLEFEENRKQALARGSDTDLS